MNEEKSSSKDKFAWLKNINFFKRLKQVKHIGFIITIIFVLILLIILFGDFGIFTNIGSQTKNLQEQNYTYTSSLEYARQIEQKLCSLVGSIKDAGNVEVMVTLDGGTSLLLASNEETATKGSGSDATTTVSTSPTIVKQDGNDSTIVIGEILPKIKGVVIVSSGAKDVKVKLNILSAIQTLLGLEDSQIEILIGK